MISDAEQQAWRESMSAEEAAEMARVYRAKSTDPQLARPGDADRAIIYQEIADRKRRQA